MSNMPHSLDSPRACHASGTIPSPALSAIDGQRGDLQESYVNASLDSAIGNFDCDIAGRQESPDRTQVVLGHLSLDRRVLRAERNRRPDSQALIMRLPVELLARVFCLSRRTRPEIRRFDPTPFVVSHVCSLWRAVALSTALLWSTITIKGDPTDYLPLYLGMVQHMLDYSRNTPLTIEVECVRGSGELPTRDALLAESPRWEHATFTVTSNTMDMLRPISGRLKRLRTLSLRTDNPYIWLVPRDAFSDAPVLEEVSLTAVFPYMLALPWGQLRHLKLDTICIETALDALALCTAVERLEWSVSNKRPALTRAVSATIPITLPRLICLRVDAIVALDTSPFGYLTTPLLETVTLGDDFRWQSIMAFLTRSRCRVRELTLHGMSLRPEGILELLKHTPLLSKLFIGNMINRLETGLILLDGLARQATSLIPGLVEFCIYKSFEIDEEDIIAMVEARLPAAGGTLRRLTVLLRPGVSPIDKLEGLRESWTERGLVSMHVGRDANVR